MDWVEIINAIVVVVGVPAIFVALINIGRNLKTLEIIEKDLNDNIRPDLKDVRERFFSLEGKTSGLFQTSSPVRLMDAGEKVLEKSGLKSYIDNNKDSLLRECKNNSNFTNPYDIQKASFAFFDEYSFPVDFFEALKLYAYDNGIALSVLRRIGAIYFRDLCLLEHNMNPVDIDKFDPEINNM
jgi:hypothetical protein